MTRCPLSCSLDGVPFLMHDTTLRRTTNVEEEFPELARRPASMLNWTVLQRLNAGQWFLKVRLHPSRARAGNARAGTPWSEGEAATSSGDPRPHAPLTARLVSGLLGLPPPQL